MRIVFKVLSTVSGKHNLYLILNPPPPKKNLKRKTLLQIMKLKLRLVKGFPIATLTKLGLETRSIFSFIHARSW